jgi:hypothetical protein
MKEVVSHDNSFTPQILEYVHSNEALADPVTRRDYFEHMSGDDFIDLTQQIASLVRTGDSEQRQHFDGEKVGLMGHEVPHQKYKEDLLRETWDTAKSFLTNRDISDEDALEYAALTVAGGILYVHPFADGNGRTSRFTSFLMAQGEQDPEALDAMAKSLSGEWQVAPAQQIGLWEKQEYKGEQPKEIEWEFQFAGEAEDALGGTIVDSFYKDLTVRKFIDTADDETMKLIESCVTRDEDGSMATLNGDKLLEVLVNDPEKGIGNAQRLLDLKRQFQSEYVRNYLRAMRSDVYGNRRVIRESDINPPVPTISGTEDGQPTTDKLYESRKVRQKIITGVLGERAIDGSVRVRDEAVAQHRAYSKYHRRKSQQ